MKKGKVKGKSFFAEFKEFINKGNAFMLAVGVVIGGAFSAIVNSLVNILLSVFLSFFIDWTSETWIK